MYANDTPAINFNFENDLSICVCVAIVLEIVSADCIKISNNEIMQ
jgi:hypothetical protein